MIELNEELGEIVCPVCKGEDKVHRSDDTLLRCCSNCNGRGKLDWCEQVLGPIKSEMSYTAVETFIEKYHPFVYQEYTDYCLSKKLMNSIDDEIMGSLQGDLEQTKNRKTTHS